VIIEIKIETKKTIFIMDLKPTDTVIAI